jgi:hypothetical protein
MRSALAALAVALLLPAVARADGLPVLGIDVGGTGVTTPGNSLRYVTIPSGSSTVVAAVERNGGRIDHTILLPGTFTIPAVAYDWSAGGLSADGRTLVLIEPRAQFPRSSTTFVVLDTSNFRQRTLAVLPGDFSFDAVSPDGSRIALINYTNPSDPTRYTVRAFDVDASRLLARPIVDPHSPGEKMRGNPVSRVMGPGGRFAYTLYDGAGSTPFIHALDTSRLTARCIDLEALAGKPLNDLRLLLGDGGRSIEVVNATDRTTVLTVDRTTYAVALPRTQHPARWWPAALAAVVLAALTALLVRRLGFARRDRDDRHPVPGGTPLPAAAGVRGQGERQA